MSSVILLIALSLVLGIAAWLLFVWSVRSGQFDDMEGPKHRMLDDEEEDAPLSEGHDDHKSK